MATTNFYKPSVVFHPGDTLSEKLEEMEMSVKDFAALIKMPESEIVAFVEGYRSVTPDMAKAFEEVTLIPIDFWIRRQLLYDEFVAEEKRKRSATSRLRRSKPSACRCVAV